MCKVKITTPPSSLSTVLSNKTNLQNVRRPIIARLMSMTQNPSKHNVVVFIFCFVWLISDVMFSRLTYLTKHLVCLPLCLWYYGNRWTLHFNKVFQFQWNWFYSAYYFDCIFFSLISSFANSTWTLPKFTSWFRHGRIGRHKIHWHHLNLVVFLCLFVLFKPPTSPSLPIK